MSDDEERYTHSELIEKALAWAEKQLGSRDYPFRCLAFVEDAYERGNGIEVFGCDSAGEEAAAFGARDPGGLPPRGAFVFYDCWGTLFDRHQNWGHVGLSLGDGTVIHAWDTVRKDSYLEVQQLKPSPGWTAPVYTGWVPVERVLAGMVPRAWEAR